MTPLEIGICGFAALTILVYLGMHISTALLAVSFVGIWLLRGDLGISGITLGIAATDAITDYDFGTIPLFVLMGFLVMVSGIGQDSYIVAHRLMHRVPGGLGHATVLGNALFSAITGVTVAAVVLFTRLAVPEMLKRGYHPRFAVGVVAGSAMLGMLIPPSILMIIYAVITESSIGDMYTAGLIPGLILASAFCGAIYLLAKLKPGYFGKIDSELADATLKMSRWDLLQLIGPIVLLVLIVLGGMYLGVFTATEAGAVGAIAALAFALYRRSLDLTTFWRILIDTGYVTASLVLIIAAASMFSRFLAMSGMTASLGHWVTTMGFGLTMILIVYIVLILFLGTALDSTSTILIAVPIFASLFKELGADLVWVGIITMIAVEVGLITPPLGMSPFIVRASLEDRSITLHDIYAGSLPFAIAALTVIVLIAAFPQIVTIAIR